jgi:hypothetical protein
MKVRIQAKVAPWQFVVSISSPLLSSPVHIQMTQYIISNGREGIFLVIKKIELLFGIYFLFRM